jgi:phosphohistidine phosphatase SixA
MAGGARRLGGLPCRRPLRAAVPCLWSLGALLIGGALAQQPAPNPAAGQALSDAALISALRQGCCVLVMRHASSPAALPGKAAEPDNPGGERQLDPVGRSAARAMGEALRTLRIPIGRVRSSPAYRARETVRLAGWSAPEIVAQLDTAPSGMQQPDSDAVRVRWLRDQVAVAPPAGTNTLVVTHAPNILGAFGEQAAGLDDGEALIFRPEAAGAAMLIARVKIEEWPRLARTP